MKIRPLILFFILTAIALIMPSTSVKAEGLAIEYDGKNVSYTDTQVTYTLDGKPIQSLYPGIIIDGVSLAPFNEIFIKSGTGITYQYDSNKMTVDLYYGNKEIHFVLGSSIATVNGKKVNLPLAPRRITFPNKKTSKIYLPARFVAETFGFKYVWNSKTGVASMTIPPAKIRYNGVDHEYSGNKLQIESNGIVCTTAEFYGLTINDVVMVPANLTFGKKGLGASYKYNKNTKTITIKKYGVTVTMQLNSNTAYINDKKITLKEAPRQIKFYHTGSTKLYVPLQIVAEALHYEYLPFLSAGSVNLKKPYAIYYDGQWKFPAVKGSVTFNGIEVEVAPAYSYLESNNAMLAARKVFETGLGCDFQYDSSAKTLTISHQGNTIIYNIGSTVASINGVVTEAPVAPKSVKYDKDGSFIMVPGRFTANALGFEYEWIDAGNTSVITLPESEIPDTNINTGNPSISEGTLFQWSSSPEYEKSIQEQADLASEVKLTGRIQDKNITAYTSLATILQVNDTYQLYSADGFFNVSGVLMDDGIELTFSETIATNYTYTFGSGAVSQAAVEFDQNTFSTKVKFTFNEGITAKYRLTLSEDNRMLTVQIYQNYLTSIRADRAVGCDTITIQGTSGLQAELLTDSLDEDVIWLQLSGAVDTLSTSDYTWVDTTSEGGISSVTRIVLNNNMMQLLIQKQSGYEFYMMESGNEIRLMVKNPETVEYSLKIPFIPGTSPEDILDEDHYRSNQFTITLPGDQLAYLETFPLLNTNAAIIDIKKKLNKAGNTVLTFTTSKLQAYKIHYGTSELLIEVGDPGDVYDKIVVLDAGHGGNDPGTIHNGVNEKDLNFQIIYTRMQKYFKDSDIKAYWTREDDTLISLNDRAAFAKKVDADLFISLHMNSYTTGVPKGLSVYYSSQNKTVNEGGLNSQTLATLLQNKLISSLGATNRKVKDNSYVVCKSNTVPAVLIELGFMSNAEEFSNLTDASYQKKAALAIYESIVQAFQKYPTGR